MISFYTVSINNLQYSFSKKQLPNYFPCNARIRGPGAVRMGIGWGEEVQLPLSESYHDGYTCTENSQLPVLLCL